MYPNVPQGRSRFIAPHIVRTENQIGNSNQIFLYYNLFWFGISKHCEFTTMWLIFTSIKSHMGDVIALILAPFRQKAFWTPLGASSSLVCVHIILKNTWHGTHVKHCSTRQYWIKEEACYVLFFLLCYIPNTITSNNIKKGFHGHCHWKPLLSSKSARILLK